MEFITDDSATLTRRKVLSLLGAGLGTAALWGYASRIRWLLEGTATASERIGNSLYTLPSEADLQQKNLVHILLDIEYEFGKNGAIPFARDQTTRQAYLDEFEAIATAFGHASNRHGQNGQDHDRQHEEATDVQSTGIRTADAQLDLLALDHAIWNNGFRTLLRVEPPSGAVAQRRDSNRIDYLTEAFHRHLVDCDTYSFLALGVAERYSLPLYGVNTPQHFFTRWTDGEIHINFDQGWTIPDTAYIDGLHMRGARPIPQVSLMHRTYMNDLSKRETVAEHLGTTITLALLFNREYAASLHVTGRAIEWAPQSAEAHMLRGLAFWLLGSQREAEQEYAIVDQLDPDLRRSIGIVR